ncbi:MAG: CPBP family intramembrane metalloprotease [Polyangiaceae bacterium]|nr:CPBP family intramembrane metalloprotease [Polyangiaceae bacterium]
MQRWAGFAAAYAFLGAVSAVVVVVWGSGSPWFHPAPWLAHGHAASHAYSVALGVAVGLLVVMSTRAMVGRFSWARRLHTELRPLARGMSVAAIATLAILSAIGEELLFRSLLMPWLGLVPQALLFGFVHQIRGPSRWVWVAWASIIGLLLGAIFQLSGSLLGAIAAHALINGLNLAFLKSHDPDPPRRVLGGLLGQRG